MRSTDTDITRPVAGLADPVDVRSGLAAADLGAVILKARLLPGFFVGL